MNTSKTIDALRRNLYQKYNYNIPETKLYMNEEKIKQKKQTMNLAHNQEQLIAINRVIANEEVMKLKSKDEVLGKVDPEISKIIESISYIGILITVLMKNNAKCSDIDECLEVAYKVYELPKIIDFLLSICIDVLFQIEIDFTELKSVIETIDKVFEIAVNVISSQIKEENDIQEENQVSINSFEINTDQLEIGQVVKNYKELCLLLNQSPTTGKSKQLQLKDFERYFEWEKSGQKFIITDIYDEPLRKEDKRKQGNNSIYVKYIELILLQYLSQQKNGTRTFKKRDWWQLLGMVNHKYNRVSQKELKEIDYKITQFEIKHFYQRCNKKLEQVLFSALNNLKNRKLIEYELQTVIVDNENNYFGADDNDKRRILQEERYVLHNVMGYEKMIQVFCRFKQDEYYRMVNQRLSDLYGWHHYYKQIKIIYTQKDVLEAIPKTEIDLQKELLNKKIADVLNEDAQKKYEVEEERWEINCRNLFWGDYKNYKFSNDKPWKIPDTYLDAQRILVDELICIGHQKEKGFIPTFEEDDEMNQIFNSFLH